MPCHHQRPALQKSGLEALQRTAWGWVWDVQCLNTHTGTYLYKCMHVSAHMYADKCVCALFYACEFTHTSVCVVSPASKSCFLSLRFLDFSLHQAFHGLALAHLVTGAAGTGFLDVVFS